MRNLLHAARFALGRIVMTSGVAELVASGVIADPMHYVLRHALGDWGDLCDEDKAVNQRALRQGHQLISVYQIGPHTKVYVITEGDRSVTTLLLPSEY